MKLKIGLLVFILTGMISQAHAGMGFYFDDDNTSFSISSGRGHRYAPLPPPPPTVVVLPPAHGPHYAPPPPPPREFGPGHFDGPRGFAPPPPPRGPHGHHHHRHFR